MGLGYQINTLFVNESRLAPNRPFHQHGVLHTELIEVLMS